MLIVFSKRFNFESSAISPYQRPTTDKLTWEQGSGTPQLFSSVYSLKLAGKVFVYSGTLGICYCYSEQEDSVTLILPLYHDGRLGLVEGFL